MADGTVYEFDYDDILKSSGYITAQCCGSTEIELGGIYSAELGITLFYIYQIIWYEGRLWIQK